MDIVCRATVYDRSYGVEPEAMVAEPGVMMLEPEAMTGVMGWSHWL